MRALHISFRTSIPIVIGALILGRLQRKVRLLTNKYHVYSLFAESYNSNEHLV